MNTKMREVLDNMSSGIAINKVLVASGMVAGALALLVLILLFARSVAL